MMCSTFAVHCAVATSLALASSAALAQIEAVGGERLTVELRIPQGKSPAFKGNEPISIEFVLTNPSTTPVQVLVWRTPFKGVTDNIFAVASGRTDAAATGGRGRVSYIGPILKRGAPLPEDFITLAPGQSQTATVNLNDYYAIYQPNDYSVVYRPSIPDTPPIVQGMGPASAAPALGPVRKVAVQSNAVTFSLTESRQPAPKAAVALAVPGSGPVFDSCSATQQTDLKAAIPEALKIAAAATKVLKDTPAAQQPMAVRYKTWFGAHSSQRYATVTSHFENIENAFTSKQIEIGCAGSECAANIFAYVYATQPYKIYVCQAFWNANISGTDSRSGTLVHEMSHFDVVAGTDDVIYGQTGSKDLATNNPDAAVTNADSHEYFAENTPNLPM